MKKNVIDCLEERGFIDALTSEDLRSKVNEPIKVYAGFDPTADSLHLGNLVGIVGLKWFQKFGHTPVVLLGGATGRIGDPSGKSQERPLLDSGEIEKNIASLSKHFEKILDFSAPNPPMMVNNDDWYRSLSVVDFLRDVGKHFRIGPMLTKESVRIRLESEEGMSFTEFSYQLLQGYDFHLLFEKHGVSLQLGGSDQWGNILAGIELIRKLNKKTAFGLTFPLLLRSDGRKFGKTEEGAVWLSPDKCSPYQFYQHLFRISDAEVIQLLRMLTFLDMEEIRDLERKMKQSDYIPNTAQKRLAEEVTLLVHGKEGLNTALRVTEGAAPGTTTSLDPRILKEIAQDMPHVEIPLSDVRGGKFVDLAVKTGLVSSKGEATRLIKNGGAYLNNDRIEDPSFEISERHLIEGKYLLVASGKKKKILIEIK